MTTHQCSADGRIDYTKSGKRIEHGTTNAYSNHGCRCGECREAWRLYVTEKNHRLGRSRPKEVVFAERAAAVKHGTATKYKNHGCRCDECREWARMARADSRRKAYRKGPPDHIHGTPNGYENYGCRCDACRGAERVDYRKRRNGKKSA